MKPLLPGNWNLAVEITRQAIAEGVAPQMIINNYMIKAMGEVGQRFRDGKAFCSSTVDGRTCHERGFGATETFIGRKCFHYNR